MNAHKSWGLLASAALLMSFILAVAAEDKKGDADSKDTITGTIKKVDVSGHLLHVVLKEKKDRPEPIEKEISMLATTRFVFFTATGKKEMSRKEAYESKQLREGAKVTVYTDGRNRAKEVRVGTPPRDESK